MTSIDATLTWVSLVIWKEIQDLTDDYWAIGDTRGA